MKVCIADRQNIMPIKKRKLQAAAKAIMKFEGSPENALVSLTFCDDNFIKNLNKKFRKINKPTDVLSFQMPQEAFKAKLRVLGDIVISTETAIKQAKELKHSAELEIVILLIHGLLHLHGYDHIKEADNQIMRERETQAYNFLKQNNLCSSDDGALTLIKRSAVLSTR